MTDAGVDPASGFTTERNALMTRSPRLLAAALVVGLAAPARAAEPDQLLPPGTDTVAVVNVKQLLGSDIVKKYALEQIKQMLDGQDAKQLLGSLGLDPLKDIEQVVVASIDTKIPPQPDAKFIIIAHGKFDADKILKTVEAESKKNPDALSVVKDGNVSIVKIQTDGGRMTFYAGVASDRTVVASNDKKYVTDAMTAAGGTKPAAVKKELADLLKKTDDKASVYAVSLLKGKLGDLKIPGGGNLPIKLDDIEKALPNIETVAVAVKVGTDVTMEVTIGMKDDAAATDMQKAVDGLLKDLKPLVQLAAAAEPKAKPLPDILASIKVGSKNKDVTLSGIVTGANIGQFINPNQ